ncbi:hypothetical protein Pst134EA_031624 [Puccinia striiformis f. sp. tritici]|uniref:uncharacterized protein n=1 Tax=Puccinia striiformis f. sp. tritici TaxID=168172 RepID=UPI0020073C54|nr:uncharacterized protein Pst134EA_031624 [Puccinia striiformis f. sp. tritici]KAH9442712.1 hypothetical protein Pst134EA_031624 [Puccinia striiformis f. sp. tritici]
MSTSLYAPFRSLGHVTTDVPFVIHSHSTKDSDVLGSTKAQTNSQVILTSVGLGWALWSTDSLRLLYVGPLIPTPITWLNVHSSGLVLASAANQIYIYKRTRVVGVLNTSDQKTRKNHPPQSDHTSTDDSDSEADAGPESWIERFKKSTTPKTVLFKNLSRLEIKLLVYQHAEKLSGFGILKQKDFNLLSNSRPHSVWPPLWSILQHTSTGSS